jgi:hypothetical protein
MGRMNCQIEKGEWTCLSKRDGKRFLGYGQTKSEAKMCCMELLRDHYVGRAEAARIVNRIS